MITERELLDWPAEFVCLPDSEPLASGPLRASDHVDRFVGQLNPFNARMAE